MSGKYEDLSRADQNNHARTFRRASVSRLFCALGQLPAFCSVWPSPVSGLLVVEDRNGKQIGWIETGKGSGNGEGSATFVRYPPCDD